MKNVLAIAGSDPSGGAGIQADLKTMCALGVYGMSAITAVTIQNTRRVRGVQEIDADIVSGQINAVFEDIPVHAVKIGMVSGSAIIRRIRKSLLSHGAVNIVLDPVMVSTSGYRLLRPEAERAVAGLIAIADIVTPNIPEAELLTGMAVKNVRDMTAAARILLQMGAKSVLVKGGHLDGDAADLFLDADGSLLLETPRIHTKNTHGTGCTLSSAIACGLAVGKPVAEAVRDAKEYVTQAIRDAIPVGGGSGPLGHMIDLYRRAGVEYGGTSDEA